jgi:hypothetical protein
MPLTEWYLKVQETDQDWTKILIDPAMIAGLKGTFGQALFLPYTVSQKENGRATLHLLSLEGWIGWSGEPDFVARLPIPSQMVRSDGRQLGLQVPITDAHIEAIEEARRGSKVILTVSLGGLALITPRAPSSGEAPPQSGLAPIQSFLMVSLVIEREHWLTVLQQLGAGTRRLVELPEPRLPRGEQHWAECVRLLDEATRFYRSGDYEQALKNCRSVAEGIPQVLCAVWELPEKPRNQSVALWIQALENRLNTAWADDRLTPGMLRTMLTGAWQWLAPVPHYGTCIPLREDVAFALGLCTDLLSFAVQVLRAHPDPL